MVAPLFVALHPHFSLWYREHVSIAGSHLCRAAVIIIFILLSPHYGQISLSLSSSLCMWPVAFFYYFHFAKADCCIHTASGQRRAARMKKKILKRASVHTKILANRHYMLDIKQRNTSSAQSLPLDSVWEKRQKTRGESSLAVIMYFKTLGALQSLGAARRLC